MKNCLKSEKISWNIIALQCKTRSKLLIALGIPRLFHSVSVQANWIELTKDKPDRGLWKNEGNFPWSHADTIHCTLPRNQFSIRNPKYRYRLASLLATSTNWNTSLIPDENSLPNRIRLCNSLYPQPLLLPCLWWATWHPAVGHRLGHHCWQNVTPLGNLGQNQCTLHICHFPIKLSQQTSHTLRYELSLMSFKRPKSYSQSFQIEYNSCIVLYQDLLRVYDILTVQHT